MPQTNPEERALYLATYYRSHKEELYLKRKAYRERHKEEISAKKKAHWHSHPEYVKTACKRRAENKRLVRETNASRPRPDRCEVCGELPEGSTPSARSLRWDHNHKTGAFRGWLCCRCNLALGSAMDNPRILRALADYLEGFLPSERPLPEVAEIAVEK